MKENIIGAILVIFAYLWIALVAYTSFGLVSDTDTEVMMAIIGCLILCLPSFVMIKIGTSMKAKYKAKILSDLSERERESKALARKRSNELARKRNELARQTENFRKVQESLAELEHDVRADQSKKLPQQKKKYRSIIETVEKELGDLKDLSQRHPIISQFLETRANDDLDSEVFKELRKRLEVMSSALQVSNEDKGKETTLDEIIEKLKGQYPGYDNFDEMMEDLEGNNYLDHWAGKLCSEEFDTNKDIAKALYKLQLEKSESCSDFVALADNVIDESYLDDKEWAIILYNEAIKKAESIWDYISIAESISDGDKLNDKAWSKDVYSKAIELADSSDDLQSVANSIVNKSYLNDKAYATTIMKQAIASEALTFTDAMNAAGNILKHFEDHGWSKKIYQKAFALCDDDEDKKEVIANIRDDFADADWARELTEEHDISMSKIAETIDQEFTMTSFDKWKKLKEASSEAGEEFFFTAPVALSYTPVIPEEIDTPIDGLHDWLWDRGYYKEVDGGVWYEMYEAESRRPWNPDDMYLDAVDEHGAYYWGGMRLFHAVMIDHYAENGQITFFVPDGEAFYTLDELSDSLA